MPVKTENEIGISILLTADWISPEADPAAEKPNHNHSSVPVPDNPATDCPPSVGQCPPGKRPAYLLATTFQYQPARDSLDKLQLLASAHGIYEVFINGKRVGSRELTPGFTAYRKRLQVQAYPVGDLIRPGNNRIAVLLSDGWFRGRHGFSRRADNFGTQTGIRLVVCDQDRKVLVQTDQSWQAKISHILQADLMDGQVEDRRLIERSWLATRPLTPAEAPPTPAAASPTQSDPSSFRPALGGWYPVTVVTKWPDDFEPDSTRLVPDRGPAIRRQTTLDPVKITSPKANVVVLDFGVEVNGWIRLTNLGPAGTRLTCTHGEILDENGLVSTDHLRAFDFVTGQMLPAGQVDQVISAGIPGDIFEPRHTTHGFRYVQVEISTEDLAQSNPQSNPHSSPDAVQAAIETVIAGLSEAKAILIHDDLPSTSWFSCSNPQLNQLHEVVDRSFLTNACAVPTDCPQRERSGFTGDFQIFFPSAAILHQVDSFTRRWLTDMRLDQWCDGRVPTVIPNPKGSAIPVEMTFEDESAGSAGWGDASVFVPWEMYRHYGDLETLKASLSSMKSWVDYLAYRAENGRHPDRQAARPVPAVYEKFLVDSGMHFGEWLEPGETPNPSAQVDQSIVATAFLSRSATLLSRSFALFGDDDQARHYRDLAEGAKTAWQQEFVQPDGQLQINKQAHYVRGLAWELFPAQLRKAAARHLADLIRQNDNRLGTGFLATGQLLGVLADNDYADLAYRLLLSTENPSWLGMLKAGATTMWEYWDGISETGEARGSLCHYSKGAVVSFLYNYVLGIRLPENPGVQQAGYRRVLIKPVLGGGIQFAKGGIKTQFGELKVAWEIGKQLEVEIPPQIHATVELPNGEVEQVGPGKWSFKISGGL